MGRRIDESEAGSLHEEVVSYFEDNSWRDEIHEFADIIINGGKIRHGGSADALETMKLVYRIYYADQEWRKSYNIANPDK